MFIQMIRSNLIASYVLLAARLYLGYEWIVAGWGKINGGFDAAGFLQGAIADASGDYPSVLGWWASFLESFAVPNIEIFNFLVAWGELAVGLGLILGCFTKTAVFFGLMMNFSFMLSGAGGSNIIMVILSFFIIIAGANAGRIGLDGLFWKPFFTKKGLYKKFGLEN